MIRFRSADGDVALIRKVIKRMQEEMPTSNYNPQALRMDLDMVHANGCPLDFERLLESRLADFAHDIFGIRRHIDRTTGKLGNWRPGCAS